MDIEQLLRDAIEYPPNSIEHRLAAAYLLLRKQNEELKDSAWAASVARHANDPWEGEDA